MSLFTGDQVVEIIKNLPALLLAIGSLIAAIRANKRATAAEAAAEAAHQKATDAARQQLTFALKRAVHDAKMQGVPVNIPSPPVEVGF